MKRIQLIGLMLLLTVGLMFGVPDSKVMPLDHDVGLVFFTPENQTTVDVVFITAEANTEFCWVIGCEYDMFLMKCIPAAKIDVYELTTTNLVKAKTCREMNSQRGYRLDIGERLFRLENNQTYIK